MTIRHLILLIIIVGCATRKYGGILPMYLDKYVMTTEEHSFELVQKLSGTILKYQKAYDCTIDSIAYNSTSVIKLDNGDTVTVYSPCQQTDLGIGTKVNILNVEENGRELIVKREILEQFPKNSLNYPYWLCTSCKYPNTVGMVKLDDNDNE